MIECGSKRVKSIFFQLNCELHKWTPHHLLYLYDQWNPVIGQNLLGWIRYNLHCRYICISLKEWTKSKFLVELWGDGGKMPQVLINSTILFLASALARGAPNSAILSHCLPTRISVRCAEVLLFCCYFLGVTPNSFFSPVRSRRFRESRLFRWAGWAAEEATGPWKWFI